MLTKALNSIKYPIKELGLSNISVFDKKKGDVSVLICSHLALLESRQATDTSLGFCGDNALR